MTLFNYWHYFVLALITLVFIGGILAAFRQEKKLIIPMIFSVSLISLLLSVASIFIVDKYTKKVALFKVKNKRLLSTEQIIYTGFVKNSGNYTVGEVVFEVKLVNKGHATGNVKGGNFFKASGFFDFFSGASTKKFKPQSITKEFVVARNLKPGTSKPFRVYFDYPPYFRSVADFKNVSGH